MHLYAGLNSVPVGNINIGTIIKTAWLGSQAVFIKPDRICKAFIGREVLYAFLLATSTIFFAFSPIHFWFHYHFATACNVPVLLPFCTRSRWNRAGRARSCIFLDAIQ